MFYNNSHSENVKIIISDINSLELFIMTVTKLNVMISALFKAKCKEF